MANGIKTYQIEINGLKESADAVKVLNAELDSLEKRIKALEGKAINVGSKTSTESTSSLDAQDKLQKDILATEQKLAEVRDENYKKLLHMKEELKEYTQIAKSQAAAEENQQGLYDTNTMAGMKGQLKSIKQEMQTLDISSDRFRELSQQANDLNNKLKEIEQSYGQYGRNVGNYANGVADGIEKLKIDVGGVIQEFDSAKEALVKLRKEMQTLSTKKDLGLISEEEEERLKSLVPTVAQLKSAIEDAGKPMDALLDTMQSFAAIASVSQGINALFGVDDSKIQQTIQKLVALQNVLQGIQTIQKQMQTGEGIGGWLTKGNAAIDKLVTSLVGVGTAAKGATVATKALGLALKAVGIGLIIAGVTELINLVETWSDKQREAAEEADKAAEKIKKSIDDQRNAYVNASATYMNTASRLSHLRAEYMATNDQLKKTSILQEASSEFKKLGLSVNSVSDAQRILVNQGDKVIEMLKLQGDAAALAALRMEAFKKSFNMLLENGYDVQGASILAGNGGVVSELDKRMDTVNQQLGKLQKELGVNLKNGVSKTSKGVKKSVVDAEASINKARIDAMKDGLNKSLMQLEEEKRQTINKIKANGVRVAEQIQKTEELYAQKRSKVLNDYMNNLEKTVKESADKISNVRFQIDIKDIEQQINEVNEDIRSWTEDVVPKNNTLTTSVEYKNTGVKQKDLALADEFSYKENIAKAKNDLTEFHKWLDDYYSTLSDDLKEKLSYKNEETGELKINYEEVEQYIKEHYKKELLIIDSYGYQENASLSESFNFRLGALEQYNKDYIKSIDDALVEEERLRKEAALKERENADKENEKRFTEEYNALNKRKAEIKESLEAIEKINVDANLKISEDFKKSNQEEIKKLEESNGVKINTYKEYYDALKKSLEKSQKETDKQIEENGIQHGETMAQIQTEYDQKLNQIEAETFEKRTQNSQQYYDRLISNYRDFLSKINNESAKQPVTDSAGFGIVNIKQTKKNYKELLEATRTVLQSISMDRQKLSKEFDAGLISADDYNSTLSQLNDLETETKNTAQTVSNNLKNVNADFVQSVQMYLQASLDAFNKIMGAVWDAQDTQFEKRQEYLDKENEKISDALSKQEEMINDYKSSVDSIEDELANSRGDRRQHLIDQLNAEMEAERAAYKEKQRLEKLEEANKKKQEKLDKERRKAQYKRDMLQAIVNGAMAVTYAALNAWPIPAIPMMALAGAASAAQIAIMASNKPYAKGGQLDGGIAVGNRHRDGGIKVLGGRAEIEGGEFITNRISTQMNAPLLEFINSKKKRIDVSDLLEFYSSSSAKKGVTGIKTKFADGGYIPPLPSNVDIKEQLRDIYVMQDQRPVVVSVVDITNKQNDVRRVQALAGLSE